MQLYLQRLSILEDQDDLGVAAPTFVAGHIVVACSGFIFFKSANIMQYCTIQYRSQRRRTQQLSSTAEKI